MAGRAAKGPGFPRSRGKCPKGKGGLLLHSKQIDRHLLYVKGEKIFEEAHSLNTRQTPFLLILRRRDRGLKKNMGIHKSHARPSSALLRSLASAISARARALSYSSSRGRLS